MPGQAAVYFAGKDHPGVENLGVGVAAFGADFRLRAELCPGRAHPGSHQAVALRLADMATKLSAVRALLWEAARAVDESAADADALCNMVKVFASEEIFEVCKHAMELHGGNGVMLDFGIEKLFRDAAIFLHMDATADISRFKIVKAMFPHSAGAYAGPEQ
jgi:alkylation response protein AidB-like acyl-CoA dehydrogenase